MKLPPTVVEGIGLSSAVDTRMRQVSGGEIAEYQKNRRRDIAKDLIEKPIEFRCN